MSSTNLPVGNPQTSYTINPPDLAQVKIDGLQDLNAGSDNKAIVSALQGMTAKLTGSCYRLNVILQQINARIANTTPTTSVTTSSSTPYVGRIILPGTQTASQDVLANRYRVTFVNGVSLSSVSITAKVAPATSSFVADVFVSTNNGSAWTSLFTAAKISLPIRTTVTNLIPSNWSGGFSLASSSVLRVDVLQADATVSGIEISLIGTVL